MDLLANKMTSTSVILLLPHSPPTNKTPLLQPTSTPTITERATYVENMSTSPNAQPPTWTGPSFRPPVVDGFISSRPLGDLGFQARTEADRKYIQRRAARKDSDKRVGFASFSISDYVNGPYGMWIDAHRFADMTLYRRPYEIKWGHLNRANAWAICGCTGATHDRSTIRLPYGGHVGQLELDPNVVLVMGEALQLVPKELLRHRNMYNNPSGWWVDS